FESPGAGAAAAWTAAAAVAAHAARSGGQGPVRLPIRGFRARGLRAASAHQGAGGGVSEDAAAARLPARIAVVLVAAGAENGVIGRNNTVPWRLKSDMQYFRAVTIGKPVVMGRKTFASIGKPLPRRTNIVVSRDRNFSAPGVVVASDLAAA